MNMLMPVTSAQPAFGYQGGKRNLAKRICAIIDATPHDSFAEVFVGGGGIFLRRSRRPRAEAINDISGDVANFFRIVREHHDYLADMMRFRVASRSEFVRLLSIPPQALTDLQRAERFVYLQRLTFGGKIVGRSYGVDASQGARFNAVGLRPVLRRIHERLAGVVIEQLDYGEFVRRYDRLGALFYLDPPYWGCETDYGQDVFGRADFERLAAQLGAIRGRFLLSINDTPGVRETFGAFAMMEVETTYTLATAAIGGKRVGELLISNFPID